MRIDPSIKQFQDFAIRDSFYIDKTMFIKEFMQDPTRVTCLLRPRKFGKTINLTMLKSFLKVGTDPNKFQDYLIGQETDIVQQHCGKYQVLHLDLSECKGETWPDMYLGVLLRVRDILNEHGYDVDYHLAKDSFTVRQPSAEQVDLLTRSLFRFVCAFYQKCKTYMILLVDEYDTPLNHAFKMGYYQEAASFFNLFFSRTLLGNTKLVKACMVGLFHTIDEEAFAGIDYKVYSPLDIQYSPWFGFLKQDLSTLMTDLDLSTMQEWYGGYRIGSCIHMNPWSLINHLETKKEQGFFYASSNFKFVYKDNNLIDTAMALIDKKPVPFKFSLKLHYPAKQWPLDSILSYLVCLGYLTVDGQNVCIPNKELQQYWSTDIKQLLMAYNPKDTQPEFHSSLYQNMIDLKQVELEQILKQLLSLYPLGDGDNSLSSYEMYFMGCFCSMDEDIVTIRHITESPSRIELEFPKDRQMVVIRIHLSRSKKSLGKDALSALETLQKNQYDCDIVHLVGFSVFKREMSSIKVVTID